MDEPDRERDGDATRDGDAGAQSRAERQRLISLDPESGTVDADVGSSGRGLYWLLRRIVLGPVLRRLFRPIEEGVHNVPTAGPAILAANHLSFADWIFLPLALNRRVTFVAKSDYFTGSGVKGAAQRTFFAG
ncbi:MAG TPA: 1-acyl-sn-glycerol-3-phosphate acyltransferase, partial [Bacillota bacterium]|nr:1-acyl-sn-glycerol-3-phosphate acyltransferase [Bacillota bacterium]